MKLESQVCSLELAKRLKELNVKQESFFIWKQCINKQLACYQIPTVSTHKNVDNDDEIIASAFTVAELGKHFEEVKENDFFKAYGHVFNVPDTEVITSYGWLQCVKNPDILAKMLVYLLESKLITL